ncbi:MAG: hypothetical protein O8C60_02665 [Candidatus Methanoperedens sp.]|nr:hypothetical protein [Candidatus Methanoperedens sp.]
MADSKKRLKNIEDHVLPSFFIGVLSQDDAWMKKTTERMLPELEAKALQLAEQCKKEGKCAPDDTLCDEKRIKTLFRETREKLKKEHIERKSKKRFH